MPTHTTEGLPPQTLGPRGKGGTRAHGWPVAAKTKSVDAKVAGFFGAEKP